MIFDELVLHNFGAYRGRQTFELTPPSPEKPIILVGGLNGGGKTTFLDAIQLALYGKRADCSAWATGGYEAFLESTINRNVSKAEGAGIELAFRRVVDGVPQSYRVRRAWYPTGSGVTEDVSVSKGAENDAFVTESWDEFVEELVPLGIAGLFLFDGEKIERLADLEKSKSVLATAVRSLLGVDIVDQLVTDLNVLRRRKLSESADRAQRDAIDAAREDVNRLEEEVDSLTKQHADGNLAVEKIERVLEQVETEYQSLGGDFYDARVSLETERQRLEGEIEGVEEKLRALAAGLAPLVLVPDLLESALDRIDIEDAAFRAQVLRDTLEERDKATFEELQSAGAAEESLQRVRAFLQTDRDRRTEQRDHEILLNAGRDVRERIAGLVDGGLARASDEIATVLTAHEKLLAEQELVERKLAAVPERDALVDLVRRREGRLVDLERAHARVEALDKKLGEEVARLEDAKASLTRAIERQVRHDFEFESAGRIAEHSERARETLAKFRTAVVERHVERIADRVADSFRRLLRKSDLVHNLTIDPETFELTLYDRSRREIPPAQLSAGERQLLAVSLLWGLAQSSGRALPTIIDTPLGRLDSRHRQHLVERYFPHASHQVVLLSTDEEIQGSYYDMIRPWVGREYLLNFDDRTGSTEIQSGYFGEDQND